MGRFISADAFVSTGQGLLGNNMFAYCNNNPANYSDPTGQYSSVGNQLYYSEVTHIYGGKRCFLYAHYRTESTRDISFALLQENEIVANGTKTAKILSGEVDVFGISDGEFTLFSLDITGVSLDLQTRNYEWSLFDLGNISLSAGVSDWLPKVEAMVSVWSPSVSYDFGDVSIELTLHVGAAGAVFQPVPGNFKIGFAKGFGFSFAIS